MLVCICMVNINLFKGVGQDGIDFLRGRLGKTDVEDIQGAVNYILKSNPYLDSKNIYVYGKSYGGYLVGQLTAQYPVSISLYYHEQFYEFLIILLSALFGFF